MKIHNRWTQEEKDLLITNYKYLFLDELHALLSYKHSIGSIKQQRLNLNLKPSKEYTSKACARASQKVNHSNLCKLNQTTCLNMLNNDVFQVLIGSLLGDGCVSFNNSKNAMFLEHHSIKQLDYIQWKKSLLNIFQPSIKIRATSCQLYTPTHPIFTDLRQQFYPSVNKCRKSKLPISLIQKIDLLGFLIWFLDDGTNKKGTISICSALFDENELIEVINIINNKYNLNLYLRKEKPQNLKYKIPKIICFPYKDRDTLLSKWITIAQNLNLPKSMYYKFQTRHSKTVI